MLTPWLGLISSASQLAYHENQLVASNPLTTVVTECADRVITCAPLNDFTNGERGG
ncbi:hypothetical protein GCM10017668_51990 [Streptomyces tuirus]|uniref:Uncharacterized protein n=1 Tax=Streptomyces tuirus TaxID=68278 RepID=A0A7G1NPB0_9ACTN|nr:hypothetical protein GCM10017668_51990 [Streptomyces tuirus]